MNQRAMFTDLKKKTTKQKKSDIANFCKQACRGHVMTTFLLMNFNVLSFQF